MFISSPDARAWTAPGPAPTSHVPTASPLLVFIFSAWQPYIAHVQTSLDRLVVGVVPAAVLAIVEAACCLGVPVHRDVCRPSSVAALS